MPNLKTLVSSHFRNNEKKQPISKSFLATISATKSSSHSVLMLGLGKPQQQSKSEVVIFIYYRNNREFLKSLGYTEMDKLAV